jgi:predicted enzyme related to lactoylglutathione lyase
MGNHARVAWFETNGIRVARVGVNCVDVDQMMGFWSAALGYELDERGADYAVLRHPAAAGPKLHLRHAPTDAVAGSRLRLDLYAADANRVAGWLSSLGASRLGEFTENGVNGYLFADPEGNEFSVMSAGPEGFARPFA